MGITENGTFSSKLIATNVQIVTNEECIQNQKPELSKYVTIASFCAKGIRGMSINLLFLFKYIF